jgi:YD repeat-containing protein
VQKHFEYDPPNLIGKLDQQPATQQRQLLHYDATGRIIASQDSPHGQRETFACDAAANLLEEVREPYYIEEQNLRFQGQYPGPGNRAAFQYVQVL